MIPRNSFPDLLMTWWSGTIFGIAAISIVGFVFLFATEEAGPGPAGPSAVFPVGTPTPGRPISSVISPEVARAMGFDTLPVASLPPDNPITDEKVELGKLLFFDPRMSGNSGISCASCHQPSQGWGDGLALNFGYPGTPHWRNSQTILNSVYHPKLFWAGESLSLESQAKSAWTGATAQNLDTTLAEERLRQIPGYVAMFEAAFGNSDPTFDDALRAIAAFEATIVSQNVPFDNYLNGDETALSESAQRGFQLFTGSAGCSACHSGALFTDQSAHSLGLPDHPAFETDPLRQITLRFQHFARGVPEDEYRAADGDLGLFYTTKNEEDKGKFRTPTLREVGQTGPYMHNGIFSTLDEVVQFYNDGGGDGQNRSNLLRPLSLSQSEMDDLVAFLLSLTGDEVLVDVPDFPDYTTFE